MGTQVEIAKQIKTTENDYIKTIESARSQIEVRKYYQTDKIDFGIEKERWKGLKTIGKVVTTIEKNSQRTQEIHHYISSLSVEATHFKRDDLSSHLLFLFILVSSMRCFYPLKSE